MQLILVLLQVGAASALQPASSSSTSSQQDIIIYGARLDADYRACAAGGCTPLRDAQVSIALAEQQLSDGNYIKAKSTLAAAIRRNRRHAATDPKPVAALYKTYATVSLHEGDRDAYSAAVTRQVRTLRDNLPPDDPAVAAVMFSMGDMWLAVSDWHSADGAYLAEEQRARAAGDERSRLLASMRRIILVGLKGSVPRAKSMLAAIEADPAAHDPIIQYVMQIVALRLAARDKDAATVDRLAKSIGRDSGVAPTLIWQPPYSFDQDAKAERRTRLMGDVDATTAKVNSVATIKWVDIGFWVKPDGRTANAEVLRSSNGGMTEIPALLRQVAGRRYSAIDRLNEQGVYRLERFTRRPVYTIPGGSHIRQRAGAIGMEVMDLTNSFATPTAAR